jgi:hypothetical protein
MRDTVTARRECNKRKRLDFYRQRRYVEWSIPSYRFFLFCIADEKKQNLASYRKTVRAFVISNRPVAGLLPVQTLRHQSCPNSHDASRCPLLALSGHSPKRT